MFADFSADEYFSCVGQTTSFYVLLYVHIACFPLLVVRYKRMRFGVLFSWLWEFSRRLYLFMSYGLYTGWRQKLYWYVYNNSTPMWNKDDLINLFEHLENLLSSLVQKKTNGSWVSMCVNLMSLFFKSFTCLNIQNMNGVPMAITLCQWSTCIGFALYAACKVLQKHKLPFRISIIAFSIP